MKQLKKKSFSVLGKKEMENIYGGNSTRIYYLENGILKWKEVVN